MKKTAALLALSMTIAFAGCSIDNKGAADENANQSSENRIESQTNSTETEISEAIADGVLTVGTNTEFPPFEYVGEDGKADGFDIALIKEIGKRLGVEVKIHNMEFDSLVASVGNKIDLSIAAITVTDERKNMVDFSDTYYESIQCVLAGKNSNMEKVEDLKDKTIGVQLGTTGDFFAEEINGAYTAQYSQAMDAVNDLKNERIDAIILDKNPAEIYAGEYADQIKIVDSTEFDFKPEQYAIAMPKGDTVLVDAVNGALAEIKNDGTFDKFITQYINEN